MHMHVPLLRSLQERLRPTKQWLAISLAASEQSVEVKLLAGEDEFDVTLDSAVAAMRPFTLRLGVSEQLSAALQRSPEPALHFFDRGLGRITGVLRLRYLREWNAADARLALFDVTGGTHYCASRLRRVWDSWLHQRAARRTPPEHLVMLPHAVEQMLIFYLRPRPVFFVSVDDGQHSNLFPMDLVGPLQSERFTLALRNTSPSVETMKSTRRIALGDVPGSACQIAYQLGAHHKKRHIEWDALPFRALRSQQFSLRIPDIALRVREVELLDFQTVGSHTLFVGRICSEQPLHAGPQLCHTCGVHQRLRGRVGLPFQEARQKPSDGTAPSEAKPHRARA
jgi:flavin reductase (DIM6/NTAB) family NADH-FMN oxidoreductase RutF